MKKVLPFVISFFSILNLFAQTEYSVFTAAGRGVATTFETDYHSVGINPANLGFKRLYENKHVTFGLLEFGASAYSSALQKKEFRQSIFNFNNTKFTYDQKKNAAQQFTSAPLALNFDLNWLGFSYQNDKIGGFAFNIRESARWYSSFNQNLSDIIFMGYKAPYFDKLTLNDGKTVANDPSNYGHADSVGIASGYKSTGAQLYSQIFNGSKMSMLYYREYSLSYGKEFKLSDVFALSGGISLKYLQGFGVMQIDFKDNKMSAFGAFSPAFGVNFGSATASNPSADTTSKGLKPAGQGFGTDIGINLYYKEKIKFGIALTNVGSINWTGNAYTIQDTTLTSLNTGGFNSYNIFQEAGKVVSNNGFFKWQGKQNFKTNLPTTLRIGASQQFEDKGEIGVDIVIPMNSQPGSLNKAYWALGGDFKLLKFLKLSAGVAHGGNYNTRVNIPVGITFIVGEHGTWEVGFASRDAITYFRNNGPALSFAFGFLRFRA